MPENLTPKKRAAIRALIECGNVKEAAAAAGVSRDTIYRWQREDDFMVGLRGAEVLALQAFTRSLLGLGEAAAQALRDGLSAGEDIRVRLRAADILYNRLLTWREKLDLEQRITDLERRLHGQP